MTEQNKNLEALKEAGVNVEQIPEAHREVLENLSQDEVDTLVEIKKRIDESGDVQGYLAGRGDTGYIIY